ncbi:MAG: hypothetical protein BWY64_02937 [bacterium ADurb.Bin363]|nr:MAG: hypothetical protein BWY64_02937 [bacterium ADurb.Bin363]
MSKIVQAIFDGQVLKPENPLDLAPNTRVKLIIESVDTEDKKPLSFIDTALSVKIEGPPDWSENFDDYLYGGLNIDNK